MTFDLRGALRRRKPDRRRKKLTGRPASAIPTAATLEGEPRPILLLDTNVYILDAAGALPAEVEALLDRALLFHSSVCLAELATGIAQMDPASAGWSRVRDHYAAIMDAIPSSRLVTPDAATWAEAGLVAGTLARIQTFQRVQRKECLNDALILLSAARMGLRVLTADRTDFDLIQQIAPETRFVAFEP